MKQPRPEQVKVGQCGWFYFDHPPIPPGYRLAVVKSVDYTPKTNDCRLVIGFPEGSGLEGYTLGWTGHFIYPSPTYPVPAYLHSRPPFIFEWSEQLLL